MNASTTPAIPEDREEHTGVHLVSAPPLDTPSDHADWLERASDNDPLQRGLAVQDAIRVLEQALARTVLPASLAVASTSGLYEMLNVARQSGWFVPEHLAAVRRIRNAWIHAGTAPGVVDATFAVASAARVVRELSRRQQLATQWGHLLDGADMAADDGSHVAENSVIEAARGHEIYTRATAVERARISFAEALEPLVRYRIEELRPNTSIVGLSRFIEGLPALPPEAVPIVIRARKVFMKRLPTLDLDALDATFAVACLFRARAATERRS